MVSAVIGFEVDQSVRLAYPGLPRGAKLALQRFDERREDVQHQRATLGNQRAQ